MAREGLGLAPVAGVEARPDGSFAAEAEPWLRVDAPSCAGRWVRLQYSSGLFEPLMRPALRLIGARETRDECLPGAMDGRAFWIGRMPEDLREIWISPTLAPGPFAFRLERWDVMTSAQALAAFGARNAGRAARYVWGRLRGKDAFARAQARRALGATPLRDFEAWSRARARAFEPAFDLMEAHGPPPRFHILAEDADALRPTLAAQTWPHWTLGGVADLADDAYALPLNPGDALAPHALAALAAAIWREGGPDAVYADEAARSPRLKPDWSPTFARSGYLGAPLAMRGDAFRAGAMGRVAHVRRALVSRRDAPAAAAAGQTPGPRRAASVILPTRDRLDLLRPCVESLRRFDPGAEIELIVLDNGSQSADALAYLDALARAPEVQVIRCPGPFNFSAICNRGARAARRELLLFLNNDVEALRPDWLAAMLAHAAEPDVGAVGAKLMFPDGRLQHGGVVLGLDGFAGHVQGATSADDPGYLGRLAWACEVSAVTGACLAVEARKFFAVGGFDEERLPIEYNDIDLCLRLGEAGYRCIFEPRAVLMHRESASRGDNPYLDTRYAGEHAYFRERWARRRRDDPYFHPALSLDALEIALG